jgi:hypothetical protein
MLNVATCITSEIEMHSKTLHYRSTQILVSVSHTINRKYFVSILFYVSSRINLGVGIATGYGLDDRGFGVESWYSQEYSILNIVQTGSVVHPTSYPMGTGASFPGGKVAGA